MEIREKWEKIYRDVNLYITDDYRRKIIDRFTVDKEIEKLGESFGDIVAVGLGKNLKTDLFKEWIRLMVVFEKDYKQCLDLMSSKRKRYSPRPIQLTGQVGILVRQIAKLCRLHNMVINDVEGKDETLEDTKRDIFNYCIIAFEFCTESEWFMEKAAMRLMEEIDNEC